MKLPWADVDLDGGYVVTRAEHNKAGRDERLPLHPVAVEQLGPVRGGFTAEVFPWPHHRRPLDEQWYGIQAAAGVRKPYHGFHDFRRSFATYNAEGLGAETLERMMRHQSYATTQRYIRMAEDLSPATAKLFVPDALAGKGKAGGKRRKGDAAVVWRFPGDTAGRTAARSHPGKRRNRRPGWRLLTVGSPGIEPGT
jgi:hypothetical protein